MDPLQFAYRPNRSTDEAISITIHTALSHLDKSKTNVKKLLIYYSSAFNTIVPTKLITKLRALGGQRTGSVVPGQQPLPQCEQDKGADRGLQEKVDQTTPINIDGAVVERIESFKCLDVHITNKLSWSNHIKTVVKRA